MSEMTPADVPRELALAAAWALADFPDTDDGDGTAEIAAMLAAVLPLHKQQLTERLGKPSWRYRAFGPNNEIVLDPGCNERWTMAELGGWRIERLPVYSGAWEPVPGPAKGGSDD